MNDIAGNGAANAKFDVVATANDDKKLKAFVASTLAKYNTLAVTLHQAAAMTFFHVAEHGECFALNMFYRGLRVNDQTALRVWFGKHATYGENGIAKNWIAFTTKSKEDGLPGFSIVKGRQDQRKGKYDLTAENDTNPLNWEPFYARDVRIPSTWDLEKALETLNNAIAKVEREREKTGVELPPDVEDLAVKMQAMVTAKLADLPKPKNDDAKAANANAA